jgi:hypothetical protein
MVPIAESSRLCMSGVTTQAAVARAETVVGAIVSVLDSGRVRRRMADFEGQVRSTQCLVFACSANGRGKAVKGGIAVVTAKTSHGVD